MKNNLGISDMMLNDTFEGFYILSSVRQLVSSKGSPYLNMMLSDCSGTINAMVWDYSGPITDKDKGSVIKVRGSVSEYKGTLQVTVDRIRLATNTDNYKISDLVPTAPIDAEQELETVRKLISSIEDSDYRRICEIMLQRYMQSFINIPAAKSVHHSFLHGLLMHTSNMMKTADHLAFQYKDIVDRSLLITGTFLHDFGKRQEFTFSDLGLVTSYSIKGQLLGHLVMGAQDVAEISRELSIPGEKSMLLQHLILSHHGVPEYGAAVEPKCAEAELLSYIDLIDSRMEIYREALADMKVGEVSESTIFGLGKRVYRHM